jgi:benzoyl-CoA reductase/2-hydroxyglutaryl-CoA dehydratase subunit BcrC/BadD/HgdB
MQNRQNFFINKYDRIFTVKLAFDISQPFVCGDLKSVVKYALKSKNGIEYFTELTGGKKISKKDLKEMLSKTEELQQLSIKLFKIY